jgi:radical SAM-linked protein
VFDHTLAQDMEDLPEEAKDRSVSTNEVKMPAAPVVNRAMEQVMAEREKLDADNDDDDNDNDNENDEDVALREEGDGRPARGIAPHPMPAPVQRLRLTYSRGGALAFISHLDFVKVMFTVLRRAGTPLAYSQGFNPQPKAQFAPPASLGISGEGELMDILLSEYIDCAALVEKLNTTPLAGLRFLDCEELPPGEDSLEARIEASRFRVEPKGEAAVSPDEARARVEAFLASEAFPAETRKKSGTKTIDLRRSVTALELETDDGGRPQFLLTISHAPGGFIKAQEALAAILGRPIELGRDARATRTGFELNTEERLPV